MNFANNPAHAAQNAPHAKTLFQLPISTLETSRYVRRRLPALVISPDDLANIIAMVATSLGRSVHFDGSAKVATKRIFPPDW